MHRRGLAPLVRCRRAAEERRQAGYPPRLATKSPAEAGLSWLTTCPQRRGHRRCTIVPAEQPSASLTQAREAPPKAGLSRDVRHLNVDKLPDSASGTEKPLRLVTPLSQGLVHTHRSALRADAPEESAMQKVDFKMSLAKDRQSVGLTMTIGAKNIGTASLDAADMDDLIFKGTSNNGRF